MAELILADEDLHGQEREDTRPRGEVNGSRVRSRHSHSPSTAIITTNTATARTWSQIVSWRLPSLSVAFAAPEWGPTR